MTHTDDPSKTLEQAIEAERARLLQIHSVLHCLYEVLLYAEGEEAATYADAAHLAAMLIDDVVANLDPVKLRPMVEAIQRSARLEGRYAPPEPRGLTTGSKDDDNSVKEPRLPYSYSMH
ncbi:MAG TPA: hypothetical protein VH814_12620 [Steroidobacteraceae bacterium]